MPNLCLAAGLRLTVVFFLFLIPNTPAWGQGFDAGMYDARLGWIPGSRAWAQWALENSASSFPPMTPPIPAGPATISSDQLRHPLSTKAWRLLNKALLLSESGNHAAAIQGLRETLVKVPSSAPYTQNLLGLEYVATHQFTDAEKCFEEAVRLMPHESANHSNLGYALAVEGDLSSAEREARKAIELDGANSKAKALLQAVLSGKLTKRR